MNEDTLAISQRREQIQSEIEHWKQEKREDNLTWHANLGNFWCNLPGGLYREVHEKQKEMDTKFNEIIGNTSWKHLHSSLYLSQTPRQFFETIDAILDKTNIPKEDIKRLIDIRNDLYGSSPEARSKATIDLYELTLPTVIELRVMGYAHFDLRK